MNSNERQAIRIHEDLNLFREALSFTAAQRAFSAHLIEKDYFCSVRPAPRFCSALYKAHFVALKIDAERDGYGWRIGATGISAQEEDPFLAI